MNEILQAAENPREEKNPFGRFYSAFGDRGVMFVLFAFSVVLHSLLAMNMELPSVHPDEIGVASVAAFYTGHDWSGIMGQIGYYYGYIQALFYVPLFILFGGSPYALYKSMIVMNGVLISFIPLIAYHLASKLGIEKVWQKIIIALCSGFYITYMAHSKFIWNEAVCSLLPWFLIWVVFMAWDRKNRHSRFALSMLVGFMCAVCYAAHPRLIAVVIALVLTLVIARAWLKEKILNLPVMFLTMAASFVTERFCSAMIKQAVWNGNANYNTVETEISRLEGIASPGGVDRFFAVLFGHIYTFMTSTAGLGAAAVVVFILLIASVVSETAYHREPVGEDKTKEYTAVKRKYSIKLTVFGIYAFLAIGGSMAMSALFKFNSDKIDSIKDLSMFGRYTDNVAPLAIMLTLAFMFMYGLNIKRILSSAGVYAYACLCFGLATYPLVKNADTFRVSPVLGLAPWRIGEDYTAELTGTSFVIMSSCVFALFALMIVFTSCSKRYYTQLLSAVVCGTAIYTTVFCGVSYLPMRAEANAEKTAPAVAVSELLYNDVQSPKIVVYKTASRTAAIIQFLNPDTQVEIIRKERNIPDNCILVAESDEKLSLTTDDYDLVGQADGYTVYAIGEGAKDFVKYKRAAGTTGSETAQ